MKKVLLVTLSLILVIALVVPYSYSGNKSKMFFTVSSEKVKPGETLEMTLNLEKITYTKLKFTLSSDINIADIYEEQEEINLEIIDGELIINVDKEETKLEEIVLYYVIPEDAETDTTYTIVATATNEENEEEQVASTISIKVVENEDENEAKQDKDEESKNNNKEELNNNNQSEINGKDSFNNMDKEENKNQVKFGENEQKQASSTAIQKSSGSSKGSGLNIAGSSINKTQETVTYNGSDNNYLSGLTIEGYELNKTFNKESSTYFLTVDNTITSLNVIATAEESTATVCISGADNINAGTNKVLISVTSESGLVRMYRVYVTKK